MNREKIPKKAWSKPTIKSLKFNMTLSGNTPGTPEAATFLPGS